MVQVVKKYPRFDVVFATKRRTISTPSVDRARALVLRHAGAKAYCIVTPEDHSQVGTKTVFRVF